MITVATARKIILSMPEAEECQHQGHPDFRVNNKIFATLWPDEARAVVKISAVDQPILFKSSPEVLSANAWSKHGWTNVHLRYVDARMFRQLVEDSWYAVAPKKLAAKYLGESRRI
jgi:hypothetical protein